MILRIYWNKERSKNMNYKMILNILGWVLRFEAFVMFLPLACSVIYTERTAWSFVICILICFACGFMLTRIKPKNKTMYSKEGFTIVALSWIVISVFGALPFVVSGCIPSFVDALFETVSGFTTTGASILSDVEVLPKGILFWRSFTHWIGGMGVLVFLVAILPLSGGNNVYLLKAESPGPSVSKLVPRIRGTAKILYSIYSVMTLIEIIILLFGGMDLFEAMTISFGTAGTGGFAVRNSSLADYSSFIQYTVTIFMILFGVNFSLYYLILVKKFKDVFKSEEFRTYILIIIVSTVLICINSYNLFDTLSSAVKHSAFQVASIITTTGFATDDFNKWPVFSQSILVILMLIGACAGSTGGGIKVSRVIIALKTVAKELILTAHPKSTRKITIDKRVVEHETIRSINVFIMAYAVIFVLSTLIISIDNFDFTTNFTAVAATINNIGPGLNAVGPVENFGGFSDMSKIVLVFDMLIGRLEIFPMLMLFSPYTWKK